MTDQEIKLLRRQFLGELMKAVETKHTEDRLFSDTALNKVISAATKLAGGDRDFYGEQSRPLRKTNAMQFPLDAVNTLLSMIRKQTPFNLMTALTALSQIVAYVQSVFGKADVEAFTPTPEFTLEDALQTMVDQHSSSVAHTSSINLSVLNYIIKMVLDWISGHVQS